MKKIHIILLPLLVFSVMLHAYAGFEQEYSNIRAQMLRLHVLANSDSEEDQALKLKVRDALLAQTEDLGQAGGLVRLEEAARREIRANGYDYPVKAELVNMFFPTRRYDDITVPAGRYNAVRLTIGEGGGENWWCVMYPPMCIPAAMGERLPLEGQIREIGTNPRYKPKLAVMELANTLREKFRGGDEVISDSV
ncbi:MAG: stage II sporulation protein R [Oscillospiraceae bacterium]|nr:stage II sporulation protein R [Oscillospiraceae bacterium]